MKNKQLEENNKNSDIKKRGRPKKNKIKPTVILPSEDEISSDENLILKLNVSDSDSEVEPKKKNMISLSSKYHSDSDDSSTEDDSSSDSDDSSSSDDDNLINQYKLLKKELQIKNEIINDLKKKINDGKYMDSHATGIKEINLTLVDLKLINKETGKTIIANKTDISCFWDTEKFDTQPWFLPDYINNGAYHVFACFCSPNCAAAYNNKLNDSRSDVRRMLLNKMYRDAMGITTIVDIIPSPIPELLEKFGGPLSLEKFRDKVLLTKKDYKIKIPPVIPLIGCMEELNRK
jgi:hypothetical protein